MHRPAASARASSAAFEYEAELRGLAIAFGIFVAVIALVPTTIVAVQWLTWHAGEREPSSGPVGIPFGLLLALWGVFVATRRQSVRVDPQTRTLTWTKFAFGRAYRKVNWSFDDVTAVEIIEGDSVKPQGCSAYASGPKGSRVLIDYFHAVPPRAVHDTAHALGLGVTRR